MKSVKFLQYSVTNFRYNKAVKEKCGSSSLLE